MDEQVKDTAQGVWKTEGGFGEEKPTEEVSTPVVVVEEKIPPKIYDKSLLVDCMYFDVEPSLIKEVMGTPGRKLIVSGVVQRANSMNQNKRFYPKPILFREVEKYMQLVKERGALGELDHPDSSVINLANVSHLVTELTWQGDDLIGKIEILETPAGNILRKLFESNIRVGISSRGLGSTQDIGEGAVEVCDDYEILCWDMVSNPSTQGSFVHPIREGVDKSTSVVATKKPNKYDKIDSTIMDILVNLSKK